MDTASLEEHARAMSDALLKVRPLGGSEMFVRVGDQYLADPAYCGALIEQLRDDLHKAKRDLVVAYRALEVAPKPPQGAVNQ